MALAHSAISRHSQRKGQTPGRQGPTRGRQSTGGPTKLQTTTKTLVGAHISARPSWHAQLPTRCLMFSAIQCLLQLCAWRGRWEHGLAACFHTFVAVVSLPHICCRSLAGARSQTNNYGENAGTMSSITTTRNGDWHVNLNVTLRRLTLVVTTEVAQFQVGFLIQPTQRTDAGARV